MTTPAASDGAGRGTLRTGFAPGRLGRRKAAALALADLDLPAGTARPPADVRAFLREAERRIARFQRRCRVPAFVPSDFGLAYGALRALAASAAAPDNLFCEWGSGFGVVACLAAMLDFDATGIEVEGELVDAARRLADDFGLPVEFAQGSFIPPGGGLRLEGEGFAWLTTDEDDTAGGLGLGPADFGLVFAYPWPDEERAIASLFERHGDPGALLLTYHGGGDLRLRRRVAGSPGR
jgi:hypothetical protein